MQAILFQSGGFVIYAHGFFLVLGLALGGVVLAWESRRRHWPQEEVVPIALAAFFGGMIGARLSMLFFHGWATAPVALNFITLFNPRIGPGSSLGAVAGAYLGGYIASKAIGKASCTCDAFAPAMALAMVVGRIGDFVAHEDGLGKATNLPWGVPVPGVDYLVHPTPLYDSLFNLLWFAILLALRDRPSMQNGNLLKIGVAGYAIFRFFVEFVRNNHVIAWGLTGQQFFCVGLLILVVLYYGLRWQRVSSLSPRLDSAERTT